MLNYKSLLDFFISSGVLFQCLREKKFFSTSERNARIRKSIIAKSQDWVIVAYQHKELNSLVCKAAEEIFPRCTAITVSTSIINPDGLENGKLLTCAVGIQIILKRAVASSFVIELN